MSFLDAELCDVFVSGQVTFEALGMYELHNVSEIATVLVDAVASLGRNNASKNWVCVEDFVVTACCDDLKSSPENSYLRPCITHKLSHNSLTPESD